jgi:hypothetical protein
MLAFFNLAQKQFTPTQVTNCVNKCLKGEISMLNQMWQGAFFRRNLRSFFKLSAGLVVELQKSLYLHLKIK